MGQVHVLYGFDIQHLNKKDEIVLSLINEKIGAGANSVLFKELRDKKGYAYSVYSDVDFIKGLKMFYIYTGISEENLNNTLSIIDEVIEKFNSRELKIDEEAIKLLKEIFYTNTVIRLESSSHLADYMLDGELNYGNPEEYKEVLKIMESVTVDDILRVIDSVLNNPIIHILIPSN
jgi:predicted Zn-dependent peptidase